MGRRGRGGAAGEGVGLQVPSSLGEREVQSVQNRMSVVF